MARLPFAGWEWTDASTRIQEKDERHLVSGHGFSRAVIRRNHQSSANKVSSTPLLRIKTRRPERPLFADVSRPLLRACSFVNGGFQFKKRLRRTPAPIVMIHPVSSTAHAQLCDRRRHVRTSPTTAFR